MPMNTAKLLLLNVLGGSAAPITYLFRDEFTTDLAAGSVNGTAAEPGPGTRTVTDTGSVLSLASGEMVMNGAVVSVANPGYRTGSFARVCGRALIVRAKYGANYSGFAWTTGTTYNLGEASVYYDFGWQPRPDNFTFPLSLNTYATFAIVLRTNGAFFFADNELRWVAVITANSPLYVTTGSASPSIAQTLDYLRIRDLPAPFDTDYGIATLNVASPADATEYVGDADGIIDLTVTAPGTLDGSASTRCGFYYRADSDLSPAWHCYVDGTGALKLDSIDAAGTRTNRISVAGVITDGATRTLRVIAVGTKHKAYSLSGTTWTQRGAEITLSLNDAVTTIEPSVPAGWTAADLRSYPRTSPAYAELDRT